MHKYSKIIIIFTTGFLVVLLLIILLVMFSLSQFDDLQKQIQKVESEYHLKNEALSNFAQNAHKRTVVLLKMVKTNDIIDRNELFDQFHALAHKVATANKTYLSFDLSDNEKAIHQKIFKRIKKSSSVRSHIADLLLTGDDENALQLLIEKSVPAQESVLAIVESLQNVHKKNHQQFMASIHIKQNSTVKRIFILSVFLFMVFSIQVFFVIRYILGKENHIVKRASVMMDSISHGVITTDISGKIDSINPYASIILESVGCDAMGKNFDELNLIYKKGESQPVTQIVANALEEPKMQQHYNQCFIQGNKNEALFWISLTVTSIMNDNNDSLGVVIIMTDISEVHALNEKLKYEADHDDLTGLYNRKIIQEKLKSILDRSSSEKSSSIVLYIDLDNFKYVNDNAGHPAGDQLLKEFAALLKKNVREYDVVSRIGGDEFVILLYRCELKKGKEIADKIIQMVNDYRLCWEEKEYSVSVSIGIALINEMSNDYIEVTRKADKALYEAKNSGKNCYKVG